jgi:hypothetical protein
LLHEPAAPATRTVTAVILRDGELWEAECVMPVDDEGSPLWMAYCIAALDTSVDIGVHNAE